MNKPEKYLNSQKQSIFPSLADSRASILIIALWSISLLAMFSVMLSYGVRQRVALVKRLDERDKLAFILEGGARKALLALQNSSEYTWSDNSPAFYDNGSIEMRYGIIDEDRKINVNKIDKPVLERLFQITLGIDETLSQELTASIIGWRGDGAEEDYYRNTAYPYEPKGSDFEVLEELLLVKDMMPDMLEKLKEHITIYGEGKVNANTASKTVFMALGLDANVADAIISFRSGKDQVSGTSDDNIFKTLADMVSKIGESARLDDLELNALDDISEEYLVTNSNNFMIKCSAHLKNRDYASGLVCVMDRNGKIYYWRES